MPTCGICESNVSEVYTCKECGVEFCESCGDPESELCEDCLSYKEMEEEEEFEEEE